MTFVPVLLLLLVFGLPIGVAFALIVVMNADAWYMSIEYMASAPFDTLQAYPLLAIPLFLLAGEVMSRGGMVRELIEFSELFVKRLRAPMGHIMIAASAMMGAMTGSSVATVAAMGTAIGPEMKRRGYAPGYIGALNASTGLAGVLLPPSIPLILYGSVVGVSVTQLFMATLVPAFLFILALMLTHTLRARYVLPVGGEKTETTASSDVSSTAGRMAGLMKSAGPALLLPALVLGGIYSGFFTPTEAAAVAAVYAIFLTVARKVLDLGSLNTVFFKAGISAAAIMFVIGLTSLFNKAMILEQVPQAIAALATGFTDDPLVFLLAVNLALLLVGMFMETSAAVLLMGPLLAPAAASFGIDPVHFGIIVVINIEIGLLTPPLATNLYVAAMTNRISFLSMLSDVKWFLLAALVVLLAITYLPDLSLWYRLLS
jgi:tripartite ATP-independent transporter DctM subunit